jgi:hypothetical protein
MLSSTAYGRNIIPPHICYPIIVQMIDFLVNCISAPTDWSVSIQILTLLMWRNFNTKRGTQQKQKRSVWKPSTHIFYQRYIFCAKELNSLRILSSLHKATKSHIFMM